MIVIGITGTLGAGKGTVVDYLVKEKGFVHFSVRGFLSEVIQQQGNEVNRDTLTHTANELRSKFGPAYIIDQLYRKALQSARNSIIESIRTPGEIASLRQKKGFVLLAVDADIHIRYRRIVLRNSETDRIDFDTFQSNEDREMHSDDPNKQNLAECIRQADHVIHNNGTLQELHSQIEQAIAHLPATTP
ncbi:MAG: AAA family ATPase [Bacteroidota bacterium]